MEKMESDKYFEKLINELPITQSFAKSLERYQPVLLSPDLISSFIFYVKIEATLEKFKDTFDISTFTQMMMTLHRIMSDDVLKLLGTATTAEEIAHFYDLLNASIRLDAYTSGLALVSNLIEKRTRS